MSREQPLHTSVRRVSGSHDRRRTFSPPLVQTFTSEVNSFQSRRQWMEGLLGIVLYLVFAVLNELMAPHAKNSWWSLRFGLVLPLALLVNAGTFLHWVLWLREAGTVVAACVAGSVEILLAELYRIDQDIGAHLAVVAVFVFTNTVMRLRMPYAVVTFSWGLAAECFLLFSHRDKAMQEQVLSFVMVLAIGVLTLTANYNQDREARLALLKHVENQELVGTLAQSNEHLALAALTDNLTGLPNRSALNAHLATVWPELARKASTCSAVMVDIDHFKNLNDRYGHLYGDKVLKRVANLLAEALRGENDFIARFGGEEFVVILPGTPGNLACLVAERLRGLVALAGLPALRVGEPSLQGLQATISCGVATIQPERESDPYLMIGAADDALYRAKRDGRNLVRGGSAAEEFSAAVSMAPDVVHL